MQLVKTFPYGLKKCVTFSYDDGVLQDYRLVELFNKYNIKASFNLNSEIMSEEVMWVAKKTHEIRRINKEEVVKLYEGHEVVSHSCYHDRLEEFSDEQIIEDLINDQSNLSSLFNYEIIGFVPPFYYFKRLDSLVKRVGFKFMRKPLDRNVVYQIEDTICYFNDSLHHNQSNIEKITQEFIDGVFDTLSIMYIWGHSYEFDLDENWNQFEELCANVGNRNDVYYATNGELAKYLLDLELLTIKDGLLSNRSNQTLWFDLDGAIMSIPSKSCINFN